MRKKLRPLSVLMALGAVTLTLQSSARADEATAGYYAPHPNDEGLVLPIASGLDGELFRAILKTHATTLQESDVAPLPLTDLEPDFDAREIDVESVPSSSDLPAGESIREFLDGSGESDQANDVDGESVPVQNNALFTPTPFAADNLQSMDLPVPVAPANGFNESARSLNSIRSFGAVAGALSAAPTMIGDHFGGTFLGGSFDSMDNMGSLEDELGHNLSLAGGDRRFKVAENTSPIPRDRIFFNYNHFHRALRDVNGKVLDLNRFTLGMEKTFFDGQASIESRLPIARGLNSTQMFGDVDLQNTELGNVALAFKGILLRGETWMLSTGAAMTLPTGDDFELRYFDMLDLAVRNDAVHIAPFLGYVVAPNDQWFAQGFVQVDVDLNGNEVVGPYGFEGTLQDQNLLFLDASIGKWFFRNRSANARVTAAALILELHYTTTVNDTDQVAGISNSFNRMDVLNASTALNLQLGRSELRIGAAAPLRDDEESLFDGEVIFQINRFF
ncbi:MAG: hypothetical protein AB8B91_11595 [Rubripirellula sp.]